LAGSDALTAEQFSGILENVEEGGYSTKQVFNLDETGLLWKRMPMRTYISREQQTDPGFKAEKD
jgi:hypothetical protein